MNVIITEDMLSGSMLIVDVYCFWYLILFLLYCLVYYCVLALIISVFVVLIAFVLAFIMSVFLVFIVFVLNLINFFLYYLVVLFSVCLGKNLMNKLSSYFLQVQILQSNQKASFCSLKFLLDS